MRILNAIGGNAVHDLNKRYRQVPPFGNGVIRRFTGNPSAMRKLAARDFEDLLQVCNPQPFDVSPYLIIYTQCALPVFEDQLRTQRENSFLRSLLFDLATWHAFAKLRLHTDTTLNDFKTVTGRPPVNIGAKATPNLSTETTLQVSGSEPSSSGHTATLTNRSGTMPVGASQRHLKSSHKEINLSTYKYHALGDYPDLIARFGTTDNASTQTVSFFIQKYAMSLRDRR